MIRLSPSLFLLSCFCMTALLRAQQDEIPEQEVAEEVIETIHLGGEDDHQSQNQGVGQAEDYQDNSDVSEGPNFVPPPVDDSDIVQAVVDDSSTNDPSLHDSSRVAYAQTRSSARTISVSVPAPRGLITDRHGATLAYSEVAYQPALLFGQLSDESNENIIKVAHDVLAAYEAEGITTWPKTDEQLIDHYHNRAWLPLPIAGVMRVKELEPYKERLSAIPHSQLSALYIRCYPEGSTAGHILGYTGIEAKLPTGPINHNDPFFERQEGRAGLEKSFNQRLTGRDGVWRLMFNEKGEKILDSLQIRPRPGGTLVTTLNLEWQKEAERSLRQNTQGRGAFVMIDCLTGEVVVMASVPSFDPNIFIPFITQEDYDSLRLDPLNPLVSRAFAGVYPPASTFKTITVAAALRHGVIKESTYIHCPYSVRIGDYEFRNHSSFSGSINCVTALVLSNNPFLYQIAATRENRLGSARLCAMARRFGFGAKTGLPIPDKAGNVPDENWMFKNYGRGFKQGDAANMAIGQGPLLATPLQIAHAICGIANGRYLPELQLIRQIHDRNGNVIFQFKPEVRNNLKDLDSALAVVRKGMHGVVNGGTGRRAALSYVSNAGKTGTAQWGRPSDDTRLAWFAGYLPADKPRYAYVALYEGSPGQVISGGVFAASIVKTFFESIRESMLEAIEEDPFEINLNNDNVEIDIDAYTQADLEAAREAAQRMEEDNTQREEDSHREESVTENRNRTRNWGSDRRRR